MLQFFLPLIETFLSLASLRYRWFRAVFCRLSPAFLQELGRARALKAWRRALKQVPAYRRHQGQDEGAWTDKRTYIDQYPLAERCVGGRLPLRQVMIDESSGSTGQPYHWIRSLRERRETHTFIHYFTNYCYGEQPLIVVNAFSQGAWATGLNMGEALQRQGIVKNTGPDLNKIFALLQHLGPANDYLVLGYPPFLKQMVDEARATGFDLATYSLRGLVGGEGMSEGLRQYLLETFTCVYSGYGATDLEIGMAGETPLTVALRQRVQQDPELRRCLFGDDSRLPMIFQYNPVSHFAEVTAEGELVFTINRPSLVAPRIRYNIHDQGGVLRLDELETKLSAFGLSLESLCPGSSRSLKLPILWVFGRKDHTLSVMGANIYPEDLEQALYANPRLAGMTRSFCQGLEDGPQGQVRPLFAFEITQPSNPVLEAEFRHSILETLRQLNSDFRSAWQEFPDTLVPVVKLYGLGEGPFAGDAGRIKQVRLISAGRVPESAQPHPAKAG